MQNCEQRLPVYTPQEGEPCAKHGDPNCLCDVHIPNNKPLPYFTGKHLFHSMVLDYMDDDKVSHKNFYEFITTVMGCWEFDRAQQQGLQLQDTPCEVCGTMMEPAHVQRNTCSTACRSKKWRQAKAQRTKEAANAVR